MAAKVARSEKRVLTRQAVSSRRRPAKDRKKGSTSSSHSGARALSGVVLLAGSLLALCALVTFNPRDRRGPGFHNAIGPVGHTLAEGLLGAVGLCAYALPFLGLYIAMALFLGAREKRRWPQLMAALLLIFSGAVLLQLAVPYGTFQFAPGGQLGASSSAFLTDLFSTVGTVIIVSSLAVAALIIGTQLAFFKLSRMLWQLSCATAKVTGAQAGLLWEAQKRAMEVRREKAARSRLEEAAFLAQLEADDEERGDSRQAEADRVAEEAFRLAKEAETERLTAAKKGTAKALPSSVEVEPEEAPAKKRSAAKVAAEPRELPSSTLAVEPPPPAAAQAMAVPLRTPVIVEPKAPPAPSKKKDAESFEFIGNRTRFTLPPLDVLECDAEEHSTLDKEAFLTTAERLRAKLSDFGIVGEVVEIRPGPVVTMYEFLPGPGIKVSKIASLADDLAMAMEAMRVRIVAPIPGKGVVGIEVPNKHRETVFLKQIAEQDTFTKSPSKLTMCVGKDIEGMPYVFDLARAPHLLIAGTTGSGKSVAVNSMVMSILLKATPEEVRFVMVDPKMLELSVYEGIPHLLLPVVTDPKKAALALRWSVEEMERRYHLLSEAGVRNIAGYNKLVDTVHGEAKALLKKDDERSKKAAAADATAPKKKMLVVDVSEGESEDEALARAETPSDVLLEERAVPSEEEQATPTAIAEAKAQEKAGQELKKLPYIVVIIDELADLMMVASREVETYVARLAQMARAAGIHLMVATQRPSTDVVTGIIKANFPTRISFMLRSKPDSMTILGTTGAEALLGMGDMLIMPPTSAHLQRVHGAYVSEAEIKRAVDHLKAQGKPVYDESILKPREGDGEGGAEEEDLSDELYDQALAVVSDMRHVSISMLQRKMRIGYNRAARMIERMERDGVVGAADGAKPREVLIRPLGEMPGTGAV